MNVADQRETIATSGYRLQSWPRRYGLALICVTAAGLVRYGLDVTHGFTQPFILFYPTIVLIALLGGWGPGLFATSLSAVIAFFFFMEPPNTLAARSPRDLVALLLFGLVGIAISGMGNLFLRRSKRLQEFEKAGDISERKRAEEALRESEDRYRDLVEHSEDLICTHDLEGRLLSVNPAPSRILGYTVEELLQIPMRELVAPECRQQFEEYLDRIRTTGADQGLLCVVGRNGERKIWEYSNTVRTENVASPIVRGMAHDVTERRRAEQVLQETRRFSERLIQTANVIILGLDTDGSVNLFNDAGEEITGYTFAELKGKSWSLLVPRERFPHVWAEFDRLVGDTAGKTFENPIVTKSGEERHIAWRNSVVKNNGRIVATISFGNDITERKIAEEALRRREEDYRRFVAQSSEGIFREEMDAPVSIDLPEDDLVQHILFDSYMAECNDALARMYGFTSGQELIGKRLSEMLVADDPRNIELTREYIRSGFRVEERESHEVDIHGSPKQ